MDNISVGSNNNIEQEWQARLIAVGVSVRASAWLNLPQFGVVNFDGKLPENYPNWTKLDEAWQRHRQQISEQQPVMMDKVGSDLLLGCLVAVADDTPLVLGCLIAPPFHEQTAAMVQLSLGWLYYRWDVLRQANDGHSASLLELLGYVLSQSEPREAAQEWINRTAAWAKEVEGAADFLLMLFHMEENTPVFQVMSGVVWVEKGSPELHQAEELAARCAVAAVELHEPNGWALPLLFNGGVRSVLVAHHNTLRLPDESLRIMRASAAVVEPVVSLWQQSDRSLWAHFQTACSDIWAKFVRPGHLLWKAGTAAAMVCLAVLLLVPVDDAVTANLYIEGGSRRVLTAPQNGYLAEVLVRPGDQVSARASPCPFGR